MMENESPLSRARKLLREHDLHARKGLAQHFLVDRDVLEKIVAAAELKSTDAVIEVGPGLGVLTEELLKNAGKVIAIELDRRLADLLRKNLGANKNLVVIEGDILKIDLAKLLQEQKIHNYKVVANLPYYITSAVIRRFLEAAVKPVSMVVMVQKEVAEQITANPGEMSLLSVSVQLYSAPVIKAIVPSRSFYPVPGVDSAVLRIDVYPQAKVAANDTECFFTLVKAGFSANRKQLINSLARGLVVEKSEVLIWLEKAAIDPHRRAETLSIEEWGKLYDVFQMTGRCAWSQ